MSHAASCGDARLRGPRGVSTIQAMSLACTTILLLTLGGLFALFVAQSLPVWRHAGPSFVTSPRWFFRNQEFGALAMLYGTVVVAGIALAISAPIGIGAAVFTAEVLPRRSRLLVKLVIELLAGIPSVVYGLLGILFLRGFVDRSLRAAGLEPLSGDTLLTAGLLLAVMVLPTVMTLSDDALRAVPAARRRAARGLGLNRAETVLFVTLPEARRGLAAAVLLGLGRALGETIAVFLVVGRSDGRLPENLLSPRAWLEAGQTLTSKLGGAETNIAYGDPLHFGALIGLGLLLLLLVAGVTLAGLRLLQGARVERPGATRSSAEAFRA